ncbi:MAG: glycosyltransferase family 4 protein [Thermoanaerobaculia bacterium]
MIRRIAGRLRHLARRALDPARPAASQLRAAGPTVSSLARETAKAVRKPRRASRIRVGVDIRPFYEPLTGVGWYLYYLLEALARRDDVELVLFGDLLLSDGGPRLHVALPAGLELRGFDLRGKPLSRLSRPLTQLAAPGLIRASRCDVFFGANYFLPRMLSSLATRRVVTVHDLTYRRFPELLQNETLANLGREMTREIFRADAVICVSESTRRDLLEFHSIDPSRAVTVLSGLGPLPSPEGARPLPLPDDYLLFVSTVEPRKDLPTLIRAFEMAREAGTYRGALVVVGKIGWKSEAAVEAMRTSRFRSDIHHLDYLDRSQLALVYSRASIFVMPSIYEGFGFPLLEAMAFGIPSIAARASSLPEIGGDAALYFEVRDARDLAGVIGRLSSDAALRAQLAQRGRERAAEFTWDRAAEETLAVFRKVATS